ncbi:MAG: MFS transporter [Chloroflexi bacterium]|nr:MFS transporter [Chloroflexota bacterium]
MALLAVAPQSSPFGIFRNRAFSLLWTGQLVSTSGTALTSLAASILIFRLTGSAMSVGLMLMATAVPSLFVGLIAGVFVDRLDRKRILIWADLIRGVLVFLIPFLIPYNVLWLYVIVMLSSAVGQFYDPAHESVLPEVASDEELASANSLMAISSFGSTAIGFAASGLIASQFSIEWAFYIDALTFLFSAGCILFIRMQPMQVEGQTSVATVVRNLKAGAKFLFDNAILRSLFLVSLPVFISFGLWNSLLLPFALRALQANEFQYGLQEGLTSVGFVMGSLLMASLANRMREGQWLVLSFIGMGIVGMIYAFTASIALAIGLVMVSGFLNAPASVARRLIVQRNTQRENRGRVNSTFFVSRDVVFLLGMAAAGLADLLDIRLLVLASAVILAAAGLAALGLPGLGQPAAEWRRALSLLRGAQPVPGGGASRFATLADLDSLAVLVPELAGLSEKDRESLAAQARVVEAPAGATIIRHGEVGDCAYFILAGKAVAGVATESNDYRALSTMTPGDFFGEIAALTGTRRTANVVADEPTTVLEIPAPAVRGLMSQPAMSRLILSKMAERLTRSSLTELPRFAGIDQESLLELRTEEA